MASLKIKGGTVVTLNEGREVLDADVLIQDDLIAEVGQVNRPADREIDASGRIVIPGLIQSHIHLCQALFRNLADDLPLLEWLKQRIWPLEAAHREDSIRLSARLGLIELIRGGTTAILDMGTVHHTGAIFEEIERSGLRAIGGKCMMDRPADAPEGLQESLDDSLNESLELYERWQGAANGRIGYAFAPRFAVSCTEELLAEVGNASRQHQIMVHSHASETQKEIEVVRHYFGGRDNVEIFAETGCMDYHLCLAHCIWVNDKEMDLMQTYAVQVLHCPGSNLKLGSGIARIPEFLDRGISVSLGADGAPCNNNLDAFGEMRLAALIQKPRLGPAALPASRVFEMATLGGARALGLEEYTGSIEPGKKADLAILDLDRAHSLPGGDIYGRLVYSARSSDVTHTIVDGLVLMEDRKLLTLNETECYREVSPCLNALLKRAGLA